MERKQAWKPFRFELSLGDAMIVWTTDHFLSNMKHDGCWWQMLFASSAHTEEILPLVLPREKTFVLTRNCRDSTLTSVRCYFLLFDLTVNALFLFGSILQQRTGKATTKLYWLFHLFDTLYICRGLDLNWYFCGSCRVEEASFQNYLSCLAVI